MKKFIFFFLICTVLSAQSSLILLLNKKTSSAVPVLPAPSVPTATAATSLALTSFQANWNSVSGAAGYRLDVATDAGFTSFVTGFNDKNVSNVVNYSVTGLTQSTDYHYRLRAYNSGGTSTNSNVIDATTLTPIPPLPTTDLLANWDFSDLASITLRGGSSVGVRSIKSQVGATPTMDLVCLTNTDETTDPQLKTGAVSIGAQYSDISNPGGGNQSMGLYGSGPLLTAAPYTIILVCTPKYVTQDIPLVVQQYQYNSGLMVRTASDNKFDTFFGNVTTAVIQTSAPVADTKVLIYISQDVDGNWEIFTNNQADRQTLATTPKTPSGALFRLQRDGYGSIVYYHQLIVYTKALTSLEKAAALAFLNDKWSIF